MVLTMMDGNLSAAAKIADQYQLWASEEGLELDYSLAFNSSTEQLRVKMEKPDCSRESEAGSATDAPSVSRMVESLLPFLAEKCQSTDTVDGDRQVAVVLADLVNCASARLCQCRPAADWLPLFDLAVRRTSDVDCRAQPWTALQALLRHQSACHQAPQPNRDDAPFLRSHLTLDADGRRNRDNSLALLRHELDQLVAALETQHWLGDALGRSFQLVVDRMRLIGTPPRPIGQHLVHLCAHLVRLRQLIPARLADSSPSLLLQQDVDHVIMEYLRQNRQQRFEDVEPAARRMGVELSCFAAKCLCLHPRLEPCTDNDFVRILLAYLSRKCRLLERIVRLHLQIVQGWPVEEKPDGSGCDDDDGDPVDLGILRRFFRDRKVGQHPNAVVVAAPKEREAKERRRESSGCAAARSPPMDGQSSNLTGAGGDYGSLGNLILESAAVKLVRRQIEHLVTDPLSPAEQLLIIEQLLMNGQIAAAADVIRVTRMHAGDPIAATAAASPTATATAQESFIDEVLLRYAAKALVLGLPDTTSMLANHVSDSDQQPTISSSGSRWGRKSSTIFSIPATVPSKDGWLRDAEVSKCPCCHSVQFSMFNRRHHCRRCGRVVCAGCSPHRHQVDGYGDVAVRTCVDCFAAMHGSGSGNGALTPVRTAASDGQILWTLSLDERHNEIARREFSYEHAPSLALALAIVQLCSDTEQVAALLLSQSSSMLAALHRYLLNGHLIEVDAVMVLQLIRSLVLTAKMRYSEIIATPTQGKPSRGLARCDALLGQIDLLSLLASANCLQLLPAQSLAQLDTWRKLRDRLVEIELWSLGLDVSTKAGLDAGPVWAAWGLVCLKAGNFQGARQRFQRCLKPTTKSSLAGPLLQEIVSVLENLSVPGHEDEDCAAAAASAKWNHRRLSPPPSSSPINDSDKPQLIISSLARLKDICAGRLAPTDRQSTLREILFYLRAYGSAEAAYVYLQRIGRVDTAVHYFFHHMSCTSTDVFIGGLLLPCLRSGRLESLVAEMRRHDAVLHASWKPCLLAAAHYLESKAYWNSLYQLHHLSADHLRACLVGVRRLYLGDLFSVETLVARTPLLQQLLTHLQSYASQLHVEARGETADGRQTPDSLPLCWPPHEVAWLQQSLLLQLQLAQFVEACCRDGRLTPPLLALLKSVTQGVPAEAASASASNADGHYQIPTVLGNRADRLHAAVLVTVASPNADGFQLAWKVCAEQRVRLDRYFRLSAFVLIKQCQVAQVVLLADFVKQRTHASVSSGSTFDADSLLVECASLVQDRDKEHKSRDAELIVQQIKKPSVKIRAYINLGWLKAAYLLAVKNALASDVVHIQHEATRLQQAQVLTLCNKWLASRSAAK